MNAEDLIAELAQYLEQASIPFMLVGSHASSYHGKPRATNDVDCVIDPTLEQLEQLLGLLGERYYVSPPAARDALSRRSMFNVILLSEGLKADLIVRKDRPFSIEEFRRRQQGIIQGRPIAIASPEDVILAKLEWNLLTPSERQVQDALNIVFTQREKLDLPYLHHWAAILGVLDKLKEILQLVAPAPGVKEE